MQQQAVNYNTSAWKFQCWAAFLLSSILTVGGIAYIPADPWIKAYMLMGFVFTLGSTFSLAKTLRDEFEANKLINRVNQAKTEKIINEYEGAK